MCASEEDYWVLWNAVYCTRNVGEWWNCDLWLHKRSDTSKLLLQIGIVSDSLFYLLQSLYFGHNLQCVQFTFKWAKRCGNSTWTVKCITRKRLTFLQNCLRTGRWIQMFLPGSFSYPTLSIELLFSTEPDMSAWCDNRLVFACLLWSQLFWRLSIVYHNMYTTRLSRTFPRRLLSYCTSERTLRRLDADVGATQTPYQRVLWLHSALPWTSVSIGNCTQMSIVECGRG